MVAYVTIGNPPFCLALYLTAVHFRDELQHVGDVSEQKIKCRPIRTREIGGKPILLNLYNLFYKNVWGSTLSFPTRPRPLEFTFPVDFSTSKDPFALKTDI